MEAGKNSRWRFTRHVQHRNRWVQSCPDKTLVGDADDAAKTISKSLEDSIRFRCYPLLKAWYVYYGYFCMVSVCQAPRIIIAGKLPEIERSLACSCPKVAKSNFSLPFVLLGLLLAILSLCICWTWKTSLHNTSNEQLDTLHIPMCLRH